MTADPRRLSGRAAGGVRSATIWPSSPTETPRCPIGEEQTISQPYIVAVTVEALRPQGGRAGARDRHRFRLRGRRPEPDREGSLHGRATRVAGRARRASASHRLGLSERARCSTVTARSGWPSTRPTTRSRWRRVAPRSRSPARAAGARRTAGHPGRARRGVADPDARHAGRAGELPTRSHSPRPLRPAHRRAGLAGARSASSVRPARPTRTRDRRQADCGSGGADRRTSTPRRRWSPRPDRRRARRPARRGDARHQRVLPDARADHEGAHRAPRLRLRRRRGRLARRRPRRRLRPRRSAPLAAGVHAVRPVSDLDVAQRGGPRLRRLAARTQPRQADRPDRARRLPWARPLQHVHVDRGGARPTSTTSIRTPRGSPALATAR